MPQGTLQGDATQELGVHLPSRNTPPTPSGTRTEAWTAVHSVDGTGGHGGPSFDLMQDEDLCLLGSAGVKEWQRGVGTWMVQGVAFFRERVCLGESHTSSTWETTH